jgi:hypothetical protein
VLRQDVGLDPLDGHAVSLRLMPPSQ